MEEGEREEREVVEEESEGDASLAGETGNDKGKGGKSWLITD